MIRMKTALVIVFTLAVGITVASTICELILLYHSQERGPCDLPRGWRQGPLTGDVVSNMKDWSYSKITTCPPFSLQDFPLQRETISLQCNEEDARIITGHSKTKFSDYIFEIPFGNKCLIDVIQKCCLEGRVVPSVVHFIWYSDAPMGFTQFLSFMSAVKFVRPTLILIHGPVLPHGVYWDYFVRVFPSIIHVKREHMRSVGDNGLEFPEHGSDVMRIEALYVYGGVYLDWDEVVLRSLDDLRDFDMTMGLERPYFMGSQFIMARKGAPFLYLWHKSYEDDYHRDWTYNALEVPFNIAQKYPDFIHVEGNRFTRPNWESKDQIFRQNYDWSDNYAMHLYIRWYHERFDESTIGLLNTTLGSISRHILYGNKELCI